MAVPYPPDGPVNYSQNKAHRVAMATRVIEAALDDFPSWEAISQRLAERLQLEQDVVNDYVTWLGRPEVRKHPFSNGHEADLYDRQNHLIIEAKASHRDDVMVAHGMGQTMHYRSLDDLHPDTRVAVLLPGRPSDPVVHLLWTYNVA